MNPILKQNKITGLSIAWASGTWDEEEGAYTFEGDTSFEQRVTDEWMNDNGVSEDDLIDCVEQIEDRFGSPEETRLSLGLFTNSGASNVGETAISRTNSAINCVFTPVSDKGGNVDGMFEWFYCPDQSQDMDVSSYMNMMGMTKSDPFAGDVPVEMPSYAEASEYLYRSTDLSEAAKHKFLEGVYHFHRTKSRGFRMNLREELLPQWRKLKNPLAEAKGPTVNKTILINMQQTDPIVLKVIKKARLQMMQAVGGNAAAIKKHIDANNLDDTQTQAVVWGLASGQKNPIDWYDRYFNKPSSI